MAAVEMTKDVAHAEDKVIVLHVREFIVGRFGRLSAVGCRLSASWELPLLFDHCGTPPFDTAGLTDRLLRMSRRVDDFA